MTEQHIRFRKRRDEAIDATNSLQAWLIRYGVEDIPEGREARELLGDEIQEAVNRAVDKCALLRHEIKVAWEFNL